MEKAERLRQIIQLLREADDLEISVPGLEAELRDLEGDPVGEEGESLLDQYRRIRSRRDVKSGYQMLRGKDE